MEFPYMASGAAFVEPVNVPGYGPASSVDVARPQNKGLTVEFGPHALRLTHDGKVVIVPASNLKWVTL